MTRFALPLVLLLLVAHASHAHPPAPAPRVVFLDNGVSIFLDHELRNFYLDEIFARQLRLRPGPPVTLFATHGLAGTTDVLSTADSLRHLGRIVRPGGRVLCIACQSAMTGVSPEGFTAPLAAQIRARFGVRVIAPVGDFLRRFGIYEGVPTMFYGVRLGRRILPQGDAMTTYGRGDRTYGTRASFLDRLLNHAGRHGPLPGAPHIRFIYGWEPPPGFVPFPEEALRPGWARLPAVAPPAPLLPREFLGLRPRTLLQATLRDLAAAEAQGLGAFLRRGLWRSLRR